MTKVRCKKEMVSLSIPVGAVTEIQEHKAMYYTGVETKVLMR